LGYMVLAVTIYIVVQKIYPVSYERMRVLSILAYIAVMLFILYAYAPGFYWRLILTLVSPFIFIFSGFFRPEERRFLKEQLAGRFFGGKKKK